jgi:gliding motility-associated-like protein
MGDGNNYIDPSVTHVYVGPGTFTIKLTNQYSGGCISTKTQTVSVLSGPTIDFTADTTKACKPPFTVNFQTTGSAATYAWAFGDGSGSTQQNPTHTYTSSGSFTVTLKAQNALGCETSIFKPDLVKILPPTLSITNVPVTNGCTPYSFFPVASINATEGVQSYFWDFGNGYTSTDPAPGYTYTTPGNYTIKLRVQTNGGCVDSVVYPNAVRINPGVDLDFTASPVNPCVDQLVFFSLSTTSTPTSIVWYFGDGDSSTVISPSHPYKNVDQYNVTVKIKYGDCESKLTKDKYINVQPPEALFTATRDCNNKRLINFKNESLGTGNITWNFGDGGTSTLSDPTHLYAADGNYTVQLVVDNGNCTDTLEKVVEVSTAPIDFISQNTVCKGDSFILKALVPNTVSVREYHWDVLGSGRPTHIGTADSVSWTVYSAGTYDVRLKIIATDNCEETVTKNGYITVYGPTADFISDQPGGCENVLINFNDSSTTDGTHPIINWIWNFGDASPAVSGNPASHNYPNEGSYAVTLTVTDSYGCEDVRTKTNYIRVTNGKAMFFSADTLSCGGVNVAFSDTSNGVISDWIWDFGDGASSSGVQHPAHTYADTGYYTITLKIIEISGCIDSISKTNYITIKNPVAKFGLSDTFSTCPPLSVNFYDSSYYVKKWAWDFDDGGSSSAPSPVNLYNIPDVYNVKLTVTSPGGCTDSAFATITILGPYGEFSYTPISGCTPLPVNYSVTTTEAIKFFWDFSDGIVDSSTVANTSHTYLSGGRFVPKVILTDAAGCKVSVAGKDTIYIEKTMLDFSASALAFCDSGTVTFINQSTVVAPSATYQWNFNGTNTTDSFYKYTMPGTYDVTLIATTTMGCTDTLTKQAYIRIHQSPVAAIISEDSLCRNDAFTFSSQLQPDTSGIRQWYWTFGNGQQSMQQNPPQQVFTQDGSFPNTLFIEDNEGCSTTVSKNVVVHPLPLVAALQDTLICRGDSTQLVASGGINYTWVTPNNNLSCTDCPNPVASPQFDITYKVEGRSAFGCKAYDSVMVKVFQPYKVSVDPPADSICLGKTIQLKAFGAPLYSWSPAAGLSATDIANPYASPDTTRTYTLVGYDNVGCFRDSVKVTISVFPNPTVDAGTDLILSAGNTANLLAVGSPDVTSYNWSPSIGLSCTDCPDPIVTAGDNITYTVRVKNVSGCTAQDQVKISVTCNEANIFVPNTFTPNGDGMNDVFYIRGNGIFAVQSMRIFNRWGEMVFEKKNITANNPSDGWNGMYKGVLTSTDTYVYQLEVLCTNSKVLKYNGTISLIR